MAKAVIFDMDGVLVGTDEYHYRSWCLVAEEYGLAMDREFYDRRLRGRERADAVRIVSQRGGKRLPKAVQERLFEKKNLLFLQLMAEEPLQPVAGCVELLEGLRARGLRLAVGSSSRNALAVLTAARLIGWFDAVVDGNDAMGKPRPDIFLEAARRLSVAASECIVVEDAIDGLEAARRAGMRAVAVGPRDRFGPGVEVAASFSQLRPEMFLDRSGPKSSSQGRAPERCSGL